MNRVGLIRPLDVCYSPNSGAKADIAGGPGRAITGSQARQRTIAPSRMAAEPVIDAWVAEMKTKNIDGQALISDARAAIAKYAGPDR